MDKQKLVSILTGSLAGTFSGLTGMGGGVILVPMMVGFLKLTQHRSHGTSLAVMILIALTGAYSYARQGFLDWPLVIELVLGSAVGVVIGARLMMKIPAKQLRRLFGFFVLAVGVRMLIGSF